MRLQLRDTVRLMQRPLCREMKLEECTAPPVEMRTPHLFPSNIPAQNVMAPFDEGRFLADLEKAHRLRGERA